MRPQFGMSSIGTRVRLSRECAYLRPSDVVTIPHLDRLTGSIRDPIVR